MGTDVSCIWLGKDNFDGKHERVRSANAAGLLLLERDGDHVVLTINSEDPPVRLSSKDGAVFMLLKADGSITWHQHRVSTNDFPVYQQRIGGIEPSLRPYFGDIESPLQPIPPYDKRLPRYKLPSNNDLTTTSS